MACLFVKNSGVDVDGVPQIDRPESPSFSIHDQLPHVTICLNYSDARINHAVESTGPTMAVYEATHQFRDSLRYGK